MSVPTTHGPFQDYVQGNFQILLLDYGEQEFPSKPNYPQTIAPFLLRCSRENEERKVDTDHLLRKVSGQKNRDYISKQIYSFKKIP